MSNLMFSFLWRAVQVTLVSTTTLIVALVITKRRPDVAARTISGAAVIVLGMTLLIPVSLPNSLAVLATKITRSQLSGATIHHPGGEANRSESNVDLSTSEVINGFQFNPASVLLRFTNLKQPKQTINRDFKTYIAITLGIGIVLGAMKLMMGLILLNSLRRRAKSICDQEFLALAHSMRAAMGCAQKITFAQSEDVGCAAVVGFFRPTVLCSSQWNSWTTDELRSVLAHELSHVCRRDSLWRFVAAICQIVHFYNPLLRWLATRLILAQELAADQMVAAKAGGPGTYPRSLSRLALEEDARPYVRSHLSVTPVFSGYLMRRVEMLRAMDCKQDRSSRGWLSGTVIASIALFGMATTAMRGFAEAEKEDKSAVPSSARGVT